MSSAHEGDAARVRIATPDDEGQLFDMCMQLHKEAGLRDAQDQPFQVDNDMVRSMIWKAIFHVEGNPEVGKNWIGVIGEPGKLEGSVYLAISTMWYSRRQFVAEHWNFVLPDFRKSNNARDLIAFSKAFARAVEMPLVMGVMSTERQPAKVRFYERSFGCKPFGSFFLYNHGDDVALIGK